MMLRVERGKGDVDREVPISQKLVETLREYWRWMRPQTYMFPARPMAGAPTNRSLPRSFRRP